LKNEMKKAVLFILVLLAAQAVQAEKVLSISLNIYKNDSVDVNYLKVGENRPTRYVVDGDYRVQLLSSTGEVVWNKTIQIMFMVFTDPPEPIDPSLVNLEIKYEQDMRRINLYNKDKLIYSQEIKGCNLNGVCETKYESYLSCPADCPLDRKDGICIKNGDGICDPDCLPGADPDCAKKEQDERGTQYLISGLVIAVVIAAAFSVYNRRKKVSGAE